MTRSLLLDRDFALIWVADLISITGNLAMFVALPVAVYERTGSTVATALTALTGLAPSVLVGQIAGVIVDRTDRRRVLIVANLILALLTCAYLAVPGGTWWPLLLISLALGSVGQFAQPAEHALLGEVVPPQRLGEGASLNAMTNSLARLLGPVAGGVLYSLVGFTATVTLDATTFLIAAMLLTLVTRTRPLAPHPQTARANWIGDWIKGARTIWKHQQLRPIVILVAITMFGEGSISALLTPFTKQILHGGADVLGIILSTQAVGGIIGAWWATRNADKHTPLRLLGTAALISGCLLAVGFNYPLIYPTWWPAAILTGMLGFPSAVFGAAQGYALQIYAPPELRGRVFSLANGILSLTQAAGIMVAGTAAELWGPLVINIDTGAYLVVGITALFLLARQRAQPGGVPAQSSAARDGHRRSTP